MQYHLWLAADTKGLLIVIPWTRWRIPNMIVTTTIFVWLSNQVAQATTVFTRWICGSGRGSEPTALPTHNANANAGASGSGGPSNILTPSGRSTSATTSPSESLPLISDNGQDEPKDGKGPRIPFEPDTPIRPIRWVDRLAETSATTARNGNSTSFLSGKQWFKVGLVGKLSIGLVVMWILNLMWPAAVA